MDNSEIVLTEVVNKIKEIHVCNSSSIDAFNDFINAINCVFMKSDIDPETVRVQHNGEEYNLIVISNQDRYKRFYIEIEVATDSDVMITGYKVTEARLKNLINEIKFDELHRYYKSEGDVIQFLERFICVFKYPQLALFTNWTKIIEGIIQQLEKNEMLEAGCQVTYRFNSCETDSGVEEVINCGKLIEFSERIGTNSKVKGDFLLSYES